MWGLCCFAEQHVLGDSGTAAVLLGKAGTAAEQCCLLAHLLLVACCFNRAKNIKNQAVVNEDADQRTLLRKYERELRKLRAELTRRNKELVDKRHLLEVRPHGTSRRTSLVLVLFFH